MSSAKHFVGLRLTGLEDNGIRKPVSRVTLLVDDENAITAGDDTGAELVADCSHATQEMVDNLLEELRGYQYHAYRADAASLDPAAELGDGITVGGIYSVISQITEDGGGYPGLSAPGEAELEDEYPAGGPMTQEFNRKIAATRSLITKTAEEIRLEVRNDIDDLSASITVQLDSIVSEVRGLDNQVSSIGQYVDNITLTVSNGSTFSSIALKSGDITIASQTIYMDGLVTFTGLADGTTTIDGACIKTGTIDADRLNLTGAITFTDLSSSVQSDINGAWDLADEAWYMARDAESLAAGVDSTVGGWVYPGTTYIDGGMIMADTVMASNLIGGTVSLLTNAERLAGTLSITGASSSDFAIDLSSGGALRLVAEWGDVYIASYYNDLQLAGDGIRVNDHFYGTPSGSCDLGLSSYRWGDLYIDNDPIVTSDLQVKHGVEYGLERYDAFFDSLRPMTFIFDHGDSGRRHCGLGAQDVERALAEAGISTQDFAGFIKSPRLDETGQVIEGEYDYALRYGELIPMNTWQIQQLKQRVAALEAALKGEVS